MRKIALLIICTVSIWTCSDSSSTGGQLLDEHLSPLSNQIVRLISINDQGEEIAQWQTSVSDSSGQVQLIKPSELDGRFVVEVTMNNGSTMRGFAVGNGFGVLVSPWTNALVSAVVQITRTSGGRSLRDYSETELQTIGGVLNTATVSSEDDLTDAAALVLNVFSLVGDEILAAEMAVQTASPLSEFGATDAVTDGPSFEEPDISDPCQEDHTDFSSLYFTIDVQANGNICKGHYNLIEPGYRVRGLELSLEGETFAGSGTGVFPDVSGAQVKWEDAEELRLGPVTTISGDFRVTRKIWVPSTQEYYRYLEVVENISGAAAQTSVVINSCLGSEHNTILLEDEALTFADNFAMTTDDSGTVPSVVSVWQNASAPLPIDDASLVLDVFDLDGCLGHLQYKWVNVDFSMGETKSFMHFGLLSSRRDPDVLAEKTQGILSAPPTTYLSGSELASLQNMVLGEGNVEGEAGSFIPNTALTIHNQTQNITRSLVSESDGSFKTFMAVDASDVIVITPTSGTTVTITAAVSE